MTGRPPASGRLAHRRALLLAAAGAVLIAVIVAAAGAGGPLRVPAAHDASLPVSGDPFAYDPAHRNDLITRAIAGTAGVLFTKSPGGATATAARVSRLRGMIDAATAGSGVDPNTLEAIVFLESAGRPDAIAGGDPSAASGLTQILPQTGQDLLGMHIDLTESRHLTASIYRAAALGQDRKLQRLEAQRARVDDRFAPRKALAATVRYLELARRRFGRADLAVVSYHMGIGNLGQVLDDYDGGTPVPYVQLFFDTAPDRHAAAYRLLSGLGDDSWLYYWRVLGAEQIMGLYRSDRAALARLESLQIDDQAGSEVLHPPDRTETFADPGALSDAYAAHKLVPLPTNPTSLGLAYSPQMGSLASKLSAPSGLYRGLRPAALKLLIELAARVRALSGSSAPLSVTGTVSDLKYQQLLGVSDYPASTGYSFEIARTYSTASQAEAFQAMLDRLQALDLIAWSRTPTTIDVTVASDAATVIAQGI